MYVKKGQKEKKSQVIRYGKTMMMKKSKKNKKKNTRNKQTIVRNSNQKMRVYFRLADIVLDFGALGTIWALFNIYAWRL